MNTLLGLFTDPLAASSTTTGSRVIPIREIHPCVTGSVPSIRDEQIKALIQQVFFTHESTLMRHVGFITIEPSTDTASLCFDVAAALARESAYDVGLIDAHPDAVSLHSRLDIPAPKRIEGSWLLAPRLWMVPRQSWLPPRQQQITNQNSSRLREVLTDFDFSVLACGAASWLTADVSQVCDGVVLVLAANKTRRLVAAQVKEHLKKTHVNLLGTVLAGRRFPVPQGLYRSL